MAVPGRGPDGDQDAVRAQMADIGATGPNEGILWSRESSLVSDEGRGVGILHLRQPHANDCARAARTL